MSSFFFFAPLLASISCIIHSNLGCNKPNFIGFNVIFSFIVSQALLYYSASNPAGLAVNEAAVSSSEIDSNLTKFQ